MAATFLMNSKMVKLYVSEEMGIDFNQSQLDLVMQILGNSKDKMAALEYAVELVMATSVIR